MTNTLSESIGAIADSLGISAEGVYSALIEQVKAEAVACAIICVLSASATFAFAMMAVRTLKKGKQDNDEDDSMFGIAAAWILGAITMLIPFGVCLYRAVTYAMNPEMGAIKKALELFGKLGQ